MQQRTIVSRRSALGGVILAGIVTVAGLGWGASARDSAPAAGRQSAHAELAQASEGRLAPATRSGRLRTRLYTSRFALDDAPGFQMWLPDVPKGNYLASFSGYFLAPTTATIDCFVVTSQGSSRLFDFKPAVDEGFYTLHAADIVTVPHRQDLIARCSGTSGRWTGDLRVAFTRIDRLTRVRATTGPI